jgi:penicillin amidase
VDSLSWLKAIAWDLKANYDAELARARAFATVRDVQRVDQLFPRYPFDRHAPIVAAADEQSASAVPASAVPASAVPASAVPASAVPAVAPAVVDVLGRADVQRALDTTAKVLDVLPGLLGAASGDIGSNSWVVSGQYTATGKPILANDPHLRLSVPGTWYQVGLRCRKITSSCPHDVAGFSMAGLPGVFVGHNAKIAWGLTSMYPDVTDFYLERVSGRTYVRDGVLEQIQTREETIEVAGGEPVTITVRSTVHGPVLSDVVEALEAVGRSAPVDEQSPSRGSGYAVALAWTALAPNRTLDALLQFGQAQDFASFRKAAAMLAVPAQSLVYADVDGHIGYQGLGLVPVRAAVSPDAPVPVDGSWPLPGWDSSYDWDGFVPAEELPWVQDPDEGFIVAANQAVTPPTVGVHLTSDWDYGYRSQRIRDLLARVSESGGLLTVEDMEAIQNDSRNLIAPELVPILLGTDVDAFTEEARDLLRDWQPGYEQDADSAAAAYFNAVWARLLHLTFADELPDGTRPNGGSRWYEVVRTLLERADDPWWDDRRTPSLVETRDEIIRQALVEARLQLTSNLGKDPERWQWGRLHRLVLRQTPLGGPGAPALVQRLVNRGPLPASGGSAAVNALAWDASSGTFVVTAGPSMRMVVDLADLDASRWVNLTGASAHPSDDHYDDQLDTWLAGESLPWPFSTEAVDETIEHELQLRPARS